MKFRRIAETLIHNLFFKIKEARLTFDQFDGTSSKEVRRFAVDKGPAVAGMLHLTDTDEYVLVEQFRYPMTLVEGENPWMLEVVAGVIDPGLTAEETMRKEVQEEAGFRVDQIEWIQDMYPSPGILSEKISLFYATARSQDTVPTGDPHDDEEDIRIHRFTLSELKQMVEDRVIRDAKALICIQYVLLKKD